MGMENEGGLPGKMELRGFSPAVKINMSIWFLCAIPYTDVLKTPGAPVWQEYLPFNHTEFMLIEGDSGHFLEIFKMRPPAWGID